MTALEFDRSKLPEEHQHTLSDLLEILSRELPKECSQIQNFDDVLYTTVMLYSHFWDWDYHTIIDKVRDHLKFRVANKVHALDKFVLPNKSQFQQTTEYYWHGVDKAGRPVAICRPTDVTPIVRADKADLEKCIMREMEFFLTKRLPEAQKAHDKPVHQWALVVDLGQCQFMQALKYKDAFKCLRRIADNYPLMYVFYLPQLASKFIKSF